MAAPRRVPGATERLAALPAYAEEPGLVLLWLDDGRWFVDDRQLVSQVLDQLYSRAGPTILLGTITATPGGGPSAHPLFGLAREVWLAQPTPRAEAPSRPTRGPISKRYADLVRQLGWLAVWPPGATLSPGDVGRLEDGVFLRMGQGSRWGLTSAIEHLESTGRRILAQNGDPVLKADVDG